MFSAIPASAVLQQTTIIAGIDEAGRGALAGPVVAGACILPAGRSVPSFIRDSKQLSPQERERAFVWITKNCAFGAGAVPADIIDRNGILAATELAMQAAIRDLADKQRPTYLLVDGRDHFWFDYPHSSIVRGDESEPCISAASIVAKVTRDHFMKRSHAEFPVYGFYDHKGYGTPVHFSLLEQFGPCPLHRRTFITRVSSVQTRTAQSPVQKRG
jgi:ribonuclease HII